MESNNKKFRNRNDNCKDNWDILDIQRTKETWENRCCACCLSDVDVCIFCCAAYDATQIAIIGIMRNYPQVLKDVRRLIARYIYNTRKDFCWVFVTPIIEIEDESFVSTYKPKIACSLSRKVYRCVSDFEL